RPRGCGPGFRRRCRGRPRRPSTPGWPRPATWPGGPLAASLRRAAPAAPGSAARLGAWLARGYSCRRPPGWDAVARTGADGFARLLEDQIRSPEQLADALDQAVVDLAATLLAGD